MLTKKKRKMLYKIEYRLCINTRKGVKELDNIKQRGGGGYVAS